RVAGKDVRERHAVVRQLAPRPARVRVGDRVARELELELVQLRRSEDAAQDARGDLPWHVRVGGRDVGDGGVEEEAARFVCEAVVVGVAAGDAPVRVRIVVDARNLLTRVVDAVGGRDVPRRGAGG